MEEKIKVGYVATNSSTDKAHIILIKGIEDSIKSEELVLIDNKNEKILGVLRKGKGINVSLNANNPSPSTTYARIGEKPSNAREVYSFELSVIGVIEENKIKQNRKIIKPGSEVYLLKENPLKFLENSAKKPSYLNAYIEGHEEWKVLADAENIPQHVGIFGTTGTGKSFFAKRVLIPFYLENKYKVLILDWNGMDYASDSNFKDKVISILEIKISPISILEYLSEKTERFFRNEHLKEFVWEYVEKWYENIKNKNLEKIYEDFLNYIKEKVSESKARRTLLDFSLFKSKLKPEDIDLLTKGKYDVSYIFEYLNKNNLLVLDLSEAPSDNMKFAFFLSISEELRKRMKKGANLSISLVIDEAPQYAPFNPQGIQGKVVEELKNLAALGRKHNLSLTLISQGVAGEIGINASIRRNLNTNFYGKVHPLDISYKGGIEDMLKPYGITAETLSSLETGRFYFIGNMNPNPIPLLISFKI